MREPRNPTVTRIGNGSKAAAEEQLAARLEAAERGAWLSSVLVRSVHAPINVIVANLDRAVATLAHVDPSVSPEPPAPGGRRVDPSAAFRKLRVSLDEAFSAAAYLRRMVAELSDLASPARRGPASRGAVSTRTGCGSAGP